MNIQSKTTKGDVLFSLVSGSWNTKHSKVAKCLMCSIYCNSKFTRTPIKMIGAFTINTTRFANLGEKCSLKSSSMKVSENHWDPAAISKNWDHWFLILTNRKGDHPFWCTRTLGGNWHLLSMEKGRETISPWGTVMLGSFLVSHYPTFSEVWIPAYPKLMPTIIPQHG